jgi:SEFIR domain
VVEQSGDDGGPARPPRVLISYAHDTSDGSHGVAVRRLWEFLRFCGIDARLDLPAGQQRQDWALWMADEIRAADFVLVIASPAYRERAEGRSGPDVGRGIQWEARLIRDAFFRDQHALNRFLPVVLPGQSLDGVPDFLAPSTTSVYAVPDFTVAGAKSLLRLLTGQPGIVDPPLGQMPVLGPDPVAEYTAPARNRNTESHRAPSVWNEISGNVSGLVIQAGNVGPDSLSGSGRPSTSIPNRATHTVGAGLRGWKPTFQSLYTALRHQARIGEPVNDVEPYGPGVYQEFDGGWVLCALPDRRAAAVADSVWDALHVVGGEAVPPGALAAVGFPVPERDDQATVIVHENATHVYLDGGTWGPGRLRRTDPSHDWEWEPKPDNFSRRRTRAADRWTGRPPVPLLRVRVIASMNVARSTDWEITPERRRHFEAALPHRHLTSSLRHLSHDLPPVPWTPRPKANYPDRASYVWSITAPNGDLAMEAEVMISTLSTAGREVVTCAELRVHDYDAWTAAIAADGTARKRYNLTLPEVSDFLLAGWRMATDGLLEMISFPTSGLRWKEVPHVEFRMTSEYDSTGQRPQATVAGLIDFSSFGYGSTDQHTEMAVTIPAIPRLPGELQQTLTQQALAYLGRSYGYLDATAGRL